MIRFTAEAAVASYDEGARKSIVSALKVLQQQRFFEVVCSFNDALLVGEFTEESAEALSKKILDNRQTKRVLLALPELIPLIEGTIENA